MTRIALLSDVHGNLAALEAVTKEIRREKPDAVLVAGDLVLNGPDPNGTVDALRVLESEGALIVSGNTDIAVGDFDYGSAFPQLPGRRPGHDHRRRRVGARRAGRRPARLAPPPARRAPAADRGRHARARRPRLAGVARRAGFDQALDANIIFERAAATDARVICVGHTHVPEVRDLGWKVIVNDGSGGLRVRRRPDRLVGRHRRPRGQRHRRDPPDRVRRRRGRERDLARAACRATSTAPPRCARGSWSDDLELAGAAAARRRHRHGHGERARPGRPRRSGTASSPAAPASATITTLRPVARRPRRSPPRSRTSTRRPCSTARTSGGRTATSSSPSCARARRSTTRGCPAASTTRPRPAPA